MLPILIILLFFAPKQTFLTKKSFGLKGDSICRKIKLNKLSLNFLYLLINLKVFCCAWIYLFLLFEKLHFKLIFPFFGLKIYPSSTKNF